MTAAPFKSTRSHQRKKSNSISALERLVVFTEATQRVKRRLRNVIAGAVGASTSRPKRKVRIAFVLWLEQTVKLMQSFLITAES